MLKIKAQKFAYIHLYVLVDWKCRLRIRPTTIIYGNEIHSHIAALTIVCWLMAARVRHNASVEFENTLQQEVRYTVSIGQFTFTVVCH